MGKPLTRRSHAPQWLLFPWTMMRTEGLGAIRGYQSKPEKGTRSEPEKALRDPQSYSPRPLGIPSAQGQ